jgi:hypothetical protein
MANVDKDGSKIIRFGKYIGILTPDIYFMFVSKLHREHPDLIQAMTLAKVKLEDGSARDFLNSIFQTKVTKEMSMEVGFKIFYDALDRRRNTQQMERDIADTAKEFAKPIDAGYRFRPEEDDGKPIFPSIDEMEDKGIK